jgi:hypothetical protein
MNRQRDTIESVTADIDAAIPARDVEALISAIHKLDTITWPDCAPARRVHERARAEGAIQAIQGHARAVRHAPLFPWQDQKAPIP